jgi:hypothetical protein
MTTIHRIATCTVAALTVAAAYLLTASAASASRQPLQPDNPISGPPQTGSGRTTTIVTTGSPWWTFVLVAAAGATFALCLAATVGRMRQAKHA